VGQVSHWTIDETFTSVITGSQWQQFFLKCTPKPRDGLWSSFHMFVHSFPINFSFWEASMLYHPWFIIFTINAGFFFDYEFKGVGLSALLSNVSCSVDTGTAANSAYPR
jgi:hypothetical protein